VAAPSDITQNPGRRFFVPECFKTHFRPNKVTLHFDGRDFPNKIIFYATSVNDDSKFDGKFSAYCGILTISEWVRKSIFDKGWGPYEKLS